MQTDLFDELFFQFCDFNGRIGVTIFLLCALFRELDNHLNFFSRDADRLTSGKSESIEPIDFNDKLWSLNTFIIVNAFIHFYQNITTLLKHNSNKTV